MNQTPVTLDEALEPRLWHALETRNSQALEPVLGLLGVAGTLAALLHRHACLGLLEALPEVPRPPAHLVWSAGRAMGALHLWVSGPCEAAPVAALRDGSGPVESRQARLGPLSIQADDQGQVSLTIPPGSAPVTVFRNQKPWTEWNSRRSCEVPLDPAEYFIQCPAGQWHIEISRSSEPPAEC